MKKLLVFLIFLMGAFLLCSCSTKTSTTEKPAKEQSFIEINELDKNAIRAFLSIEQAKLDILDALQSFPYTRIKDQSLINLKNKTDYFEFRTSKLAFTEYNQNPQGIHILEVLCLSEDDWGRRDLSRNRISYRVQKPTQEEAEKIAQSIRQDAEILENLENKKVKKIVNTEVRQYQKTNSLTADGIIGKNTINSFIQHASIIDIQSLTTQVTYPEKPKFKAYIIQAEAMDPAEFNKGFVSIEKVEKNALSLAQFENMARENKRFLICIYFLDRVNPSYGLKWGLTTSPDGRSDNMSSVFYTQPNTWPMVVQEFTTKSTTKSDIKNSKLYVNLYKKPEGFLDLNKIISSQEIK